MNTTIDLEVAANSKTAFKKQNEIIELNSNALLYNQNYESSKSELKSNPTKSNIIEFTQLKYRPSLSYFKKTQKWVGHVLEINDNEFTAILEDLTHGGTNESIDFEISEISDEDKGLLKVGAAFYWSIGYSVEKGQVKKESIIRFQRIYNWEQQEFDSAIDRASELVDNLKWD